MRVLRVIPLACLCFLGACPATPPLTLVAIGLTVSNLRLTGPETIGEGQSQSFTVTFDVKIEDTFTATPTLLVKDQDLAPENVLSPGDDTLVMRLAGLPDAPASGGPPVEVSGVVNTFELTCSPTAVGLTVQGAGPGGGDSAEGGTNAFGSDPADIYVELNGETSNVLTVSCTPAD